MSFRKKTTLIFGSLIMFLAQYCWANPVPKHVERDTAIQNEVLIHINTYRQQRGLPKLKMNNHIVQVAKQHSINMANQHIAFGHTGFMARIKTLRKQIKNAGAGSENVAFNYKDAQTVVQNWIRSSGHKRNIVGNYDLTGIGVAHDKQGRIYYTQIFMRTEKQKHRAVARPSFGALTSLNRG